METKSFLSEDEGKKMEKYSDFGKILLKLYFNTNTQYYVKNVNTMHNTKYMY